MPTEAAPFIGLIDLDSPDQVIGKGAVRDARNVITRGVQGRMRYESVLGTTLIPNSALPSGINKCIGLWYDPDNNLTYDFNFNSGGLHGIYILNNATRTFQTLIQTGTNTQGDPLGFTASGRINGVRMYYADNNTGNLLFFLDSLGRPTKINVQRFLGVTGFTPYNPIKRAFINVIKAPPIMQPRVTYENDFTVNANNLINSLFQFAYTYIYDDYEESVIGTASKVPLPDQPFSNTINIPVSTDSRISLYLQTGDQNVVKIRIYMRQIQNGVQSGWFIVDTIEKSALSIPNNGIYRYLFFNNGNYVLADPGFTVLLFDYVPQSANCQELLDGNIISYSGITEGYNYFPSIFSENLIGNYNQDGVYEVNGALFFADYNGQFTGSQPQIEVFLTGAGTNDAFGNPLTLNFAPIQLFVRAKSNGTDITFAYVLGLTNIATVLAGLQAAAVAAGWVIVSSSTNSFVTYYPTGTVVFQSSYSRGFTPGTPVSTVFSFYPQGNIALGTLYFDANGITNGVITDVTANITTLPYTQLGNPTSTEVQMNMNGIIPPSWAVYWRPCKTNTLTYLKHLYWVCNQAFSNVGALVTNQYAYFGISNIADYNLQINATQGVVGYEFSQGDRIRVIQRYDSIGNTYPLNLDYTILGVAVNPIINGIAQNGTFVQIAYPAADIAANPNFNFVNTYNATGYADFQSYEILLYSIAENNVPQTENTGSTEQQGNVFYEFGDTFGIGNPGTNIAYHMGNLADNIVGFSDGDIFYRQRTVPAGNTFYINVSAYNASNRYTSALIEITPIIVAGQYTISNQTNVAASITPGVYPNFSDTGFFYENLSTITETIRIRGTLPVGASGPTFVDVYVKINTASTVILIPVVINSDPVIQAPATPIDIVIDATFGVPMGGKCWLIFGNGTMVVNANYYPFQLRIDVQKNITIAIFEPSYSDVYNLITNSDNRPNLQDTTALQSYFSTYFKYSENFQQGTNLNNMNRFYPANFDEFDKSKGDVIRMVENGRVIDIFQKLRIGFIGVYGKFIKNSSGQLELIVTDEVITQNNIQYYEGEFGLTTPDALAVYGYRRYFCDLIKGYICRLSKDGIIPISLLNKVQTFTGATLPTYLNNFVYPFGGNSVILGVYNFVTDRDSEAIFVFQPGTMGGITIPGQSLAFVEEGNRWSSFYDFAPDAIVCAGNLLISAYNGALYSHDNSTAYANFYGTQYKPSITIVRNEMPQVQKTFISIGQTSNVNWISPFIYTDSYSYPGQVQQSNLVAGDFQLLESQFFASFLRDINSIGGVGNGDSLKGSLIVIQLQVTNGANFAYLSEVVMKFITSPVLIK